MATMRVREDTTWKHSSQDNIDASSTVGIYVQGLILLGPVQQDCDKERKKKRAKIAVSHSMLIAIWHILKDGVEFRDLGSDYYNQFNREKKANSLMKKLLNLGFFSCD